MFHRAGVAPAYLMILMKCLIVQLDLKLNTILSFTTRHHHPQQQTFWPVPSLLGDLNSIDNIIITQVKNFLANKYYPPPHTGLRSLTMCPFRVYIKSLGMADPNIVLQGKIYQRITNKIL